MAGVTKALVIKIAAGLAAATVVTAAIVVLTSGGERVLPKPTAWIDDPLHGSVMALGTVQVLAHAADPAGIESLELAVNGIVAGSHPAPGNPAFWMAGFEWIAEAPGSAVLRIRARNTSGVWGAPAFVTVHIGVAAVRPSVEPSPSLTPSVGPQPSTTTATPSKKPTTAPRTTTAPPTTAAPCLNLAAPQLVAPEHRIAIGTFTPTLRWNYPGDCLPAGFQVQVSLLRDFSRVDRSGTTDGNGRQWTVSPALLDCKTYYWRVRSYTGRTLSAWAGPYSFDVRVGRCP